MFEKMFAKRNKVIDTKKFFDIVLYHDQGNTVEIKSISLDVLDFIKIHLGHDKVLITEEFLINLSRFSLVNFKEVKQTT